MTRSLLSFREFPSETGTHAGTIIAFHGRGGDLEQLIPLCRAAAPEFDIVAAEAPRSMIPYTVEFTLDYRGYSWYPVQDGGCPEPVRFGDNLWYAEQLVVDVLERQRSESPVFLLGYDEGAVLALNLAGTMPEFLAGVVSIRGYLPKIPGWTLPVADVKRLPILLASDSSFEGIPEAMSAITADELRRLGANVTVLSLPKIYNDPLAAEAILAAWFREVNSANSHRAFLHSGGSTSDHTTN